jgi:hypothetical protein
MANWQEKLDPLEDFIKANSEIKITEKSRSIPRTLQKDFYAVCDSFLSAFISEECSDMLSLLMNMRDVYIDAEKKISDSSLSAAEKPLHPVFEWNPNGRSSLHYDAYSKINISEDIDVSEDEFEQFYKDFNSTPGFMKRLRYDLSGSKPKAKLIYTKAEEYLMAHAPMQYLNNISYEILFMLLVGKYDFNAFRDSAVSNILEKYKTVFDAVYRNWIVMTLLNEFKISQYYSMIMKNMDGKEYLKQSISVKFNRIPGPIPAENNEIDFSQSQYPYSVAFCNIMGESIHYKKFFGVQTINYVPQEMYLFTNESLKKVEYRKAAAVLEANPILLYKNSNALDAIHVADHDSHWIPNSVIGVGKKIAGFYNTLPAWIDEYTSQISNFVVFIPPEPGGENLDLPTPSNNLRIINCAFDSSPVRQIAQNCIAEK